MTATDTFLLELTARDLMTPEPIVLPERLPLREAARLLWKNHVSGAPVVNVEGRCVGVLSAADYVHLAAVSKPVSPSVPSLPKTCTHQAKRLGDNGEELITCVLPLGICPLQAWRRGSNGSKRVICTEPHCVGCDWQIVEMEELPDVEVRRAMTANPVMVRPHMLIRDLARMMIDGGIHRVIVVDEERRPIGIVASTDIMGAVAHTEHAAIDSGYAGRTRTTDESGATRR